jgi:CrcB protein
MSHSTRNLLALILGGFVGAVLRYEIGEWLPYAADGFPWSTLLINLVGCLFLGWFLTLTLNTLNLRPEIRLGLGTGMTGSFTTFSTFTVQSIHLLTIGYTQSALLYIVASVFGGLLLSFLGMTLAQAQIRKRQRRLSR